MHHPFSAQYSVNSPQQKYEWPELPMPSTARSSRTIDTISARSIAIVQVAKRAIHPSHHDLEKFPLPYPLSAITENSVTPYTARSKTIMLSPPIVPSHTIASDALEPNVNMPPKALTRPRLMIVTTAIQGELDRYPHLELVVDNQMEEGSATRLTPAYMPTAKSHLSFSSSDSGSSWGASRSLPSTPEAIQGEQHSITGTPPLAKAVSAEASLPKRHSLQVEAAPAATRAMPTKPVFSVRGARFRAMGYANPIPSRWSSSTSSVSQSTTSLSSSQPLKEAVDPDQHGDAPPKSALPSPFIEESSTVDTT